MNSGQATLYRNPDGIWRAPILDAQPWLDHGFGTALARPTGEWRELKQIHSAEVVGCDDWREGQEADALVTAQPGTRIAVKSADCLPVLLADPEKKAVAAIHAGWRGCVAGVVVRAVEQMQLLFGSRPEALLAAFGPSIRLCCFEVGLDVAQQFSPWFPEWESGTAPTHVNLPEASRRQLVSAGLLAEHISSIAPCTMCGGTIAEPQEFHSWRRNHTKGARMHSVIWVK